MSKGLPKTVVASAAADQPAKASKSNGNGANLGFEAQLFLAADKLPKNLEPSDYKHVPPALAAPAPAPCSLLMRGRAPRVCVCTPGAPAPAGQCPRGAG
jgi:hypothetical protein